MERLKTREVVPAGERSVASRWPRNGCVILNINSTSSSGVVALTVKVRVTLPALSGMAAFTLTSATLASVSALTPVACAAKRVNSSASMSPKP